MAENKKLFFKFTDKLKRIKHLDIILTVLFISIILLIYFSTSSTGQASSQIGGLNSNAESEFKDSSYDAYVLSLTKQLEQLVSSVKDAGQVKALIYFEEGVKTEIAYNYETKTLKDGTKVETKSPVLISRNGTEEPIILQEIMPNPVSIVIVATGAKDTNVKLEILRLVQAMFKLNASNIEIFAGN